MANLEWIWLLLFSLSQLVQSDEYPVDNWQTPNEHMADFKETYSVGDTIIIEWAGWDSFYTENLMQNKTKANLYVNSWSDEETTEPVILASGIIISKHGTHEWTINTSPEDLKQTNEYSFSFMPDGSLYAVDEDYGIWSPGIRIKSRSTTSSPTSTSSGVPATSSITSTTVPTPASVSSTSDGLSTGAKAGIGAGVGIGGFVLLSLLGFFLLRLRNRDSSQEMAVVTEVSGLGISQTPGDESHQKFYPSEHVLPTGSVSPAELSSTSGR